MPLEVVALLVVGLVCVATLHELTHVLIARAYGHPTICVAINPIGVAVVFQDSSGRRYWLWQVLLPAAVTWAVTSAWLLALGWFSSAHAGAVWSSDFFRPAVLAGLLAGCTSAGDVVSAAIQRLRPSSGVARIERDLQQLRRLPGLVFFTSYGQRWRPYWEALGERPRSAPAAD